MVVRHGRRIEDFNPSTSRDVFLNLSEVHARYLVSPVFVHPRAALIGNVPLEIGDARVQSVVREEIAIDRDFLPRAKRGELFAQIDGGELSHGLSGLPPKSRVGCTGGKTLSLAHGSRLGWGVTAGSGQ